MCIAYYGPSIIVNMRLSTDIFSLCSTHTQRSNLDQFSFDRRSETIRIPNRDLNPAGLAI